TSRASMWTRRPRYARGTDGRSRRVPRPPATCSSAVRTEPSGSSGRRTGCSVRRRFWDISSMEVLHGIDQRPAESGPSVATIGVFDGVHRGHAVLFERVVSEAQAIGLVGNGGRRISSSDIRRFVADGDVAAAAQFLGHPYRLAGRVVRGQEIARELHGLPTVNLEAHPRACVPGLGVYAGWWV